MGICRWEWFVWHKKHCFFASHDRQTRYMLHRGFCFAAGSCFFRSCLTGISSSSRRHQSCEQPQATESLDNLSLDNLSRQSTNAFFLGFQTTRWGVFSRGFGPCSSFRAMVFCCRELLFSKLFYRHQQQQPWCFAAGSCFFRSCFTGISSSSRRQQNLSTNAVFLDFLDFSRFPDDTLGSFFAWFWTLLVLPSHGVLLPGAAFFEAVLPASAAAAAATSSASSRRQQNLLTISRQCAVFLGFQTTR